MATLGSTAPNGRMTQGMRARAAMAVLAIAMGTGAACGREPSGPTGGARAARSFALAWEAAWPAGYQQFQASSGGSSGVDFTRVRVVLNNADGSVALDTVVSFPAGSTELTVTLSVPLPATAPPTGVPLALNLKYVNAAGDTVFRGGPVTVNAVPAAPGSGPPPPAPITIPIAYTGPGANATGVVITPRTLTVNTGQPFSFTARAVDASGNTVPNTPIVFSSANAVLATVNAATGQGAAGAARGTTTILAQLLTGPSDGATLTIVSPPANLAAVSGSGQTANVSTTLPQPVVVRATAVDGLPASGVVVSFAAQNGGAAGQATVTTGADGTASTTWRLGPTAGTQSLLASASGLAGSPVTFTATARPVDPVRLDIETQPPATVGAGVPFGLVVRALTAIGTVATGFTGPVTVALPATTAVGTVLTGTATVSAVAGVATFTGLSINRVGTYTLSATAASLLGATTAGVQVVPGPATRLAFQNYPVAGAVAGQVLDPVTVEARDAAGNLATGFTGDVSLTVPGAALRADIVSSSRTAPDLTAVGERELAHSVIGTTTVRAVGGIATFSSLRMTAAGAQALVASAAGLPTVTGPGFTVTPGPASNLSLVSGGGQSGAGGAALAQQIVVRVADAFGNSVSGVTVSFTPASGNGSASPTSAVSDASGFARTTWTLGFASGTQSLTASGTNLASLTVTASATQATGTAGVYGNSTEFSSASNHLANYLLGSAVVVPAGGTLTHLALISKSSGQMVKMALYTDVNGNPGSLVAASAAATLVVGVNEFAVTSTALSAGTYWIMAVYNVDASIGIRFGVGTDVVKYISFAFGGAIPSTFPTPTVYSGQGFNYYIRVQ